MTVYPGRGTFYPPKINRYVPGMRADANIDLNGLTRIYFGALTNADTDAVGDGILMVNGSAVTQLYGATEGIIGGTGAPYGRNLTFVASSTNTRGVTITGRDYLGQPMIETLTLTSATAVSGKKAFYKVDKIVFASASDTTTVDVGYGNRFGVPYAMISSLHEVVDGVASPNYGGPVTIGKEINATDLAAGTSHWLASPMRGYVTRLTTTVITGVGTGGTLTVEIATAAVAGLSNVIANSATAGTVVTDTPTDLYGSSGLITAQGAIELVGDAAFATSGVVYEAVEITPVGLIPFTSGTQTATTYDPRGLFEPSTTPDGTKVFELIGLVDTANSNGFYGATHYFG